jgi:hypothetical protein
MEKSLFYTPEPEPEPIIIEKIVQAPSVPNLPTPTTPTDYRRDRDAVFPPPAVSFRPSGHQSKFSRLTGSVKHSYAPSLTSTKHGYTPSIAGTVKTKGTTASRREEREWDNFYIAEEDSDDDAYDKMTLGREFARILPEVRKPVGAGNRRPTKKALKWLGLA